MESVMQALRAEKVLVAQIETPQAVEQAAEIAAVDGVDVVFIGCDDLSRSSGQPMGTPRQKGAFAAELQRVAEAAQKHNKIAGGVFHDPQAAEEAVALGYRLLVGGSDAQFLADRSQAASAALRAALA